MTLIVETGQALSNSESYASVSDADAYFQKRGITIWTQQTDTEKEQALVRATGYMLQVYRGRWRGDRVKFDQALDWPRMNVQLESDGQFFYGFGYVPYDSVPNEVKNACIELALRASIGELLEDLSQGVVRETVGPITTVYDTDSARQKQYASVDGMLRPYLKASPGGAMMKLSRC